MKILDKFLQGLGFEGEDVEYTPVEKKVKEKKVKEKKVKPEKKTISSINDGMTFNFDKKQEIPAEEETIKEETVEEVDSLPQSTAGFDVEVPKSQVEVQAIVEKVTNGKTIIINVSGFNATDRVRALDFISGAIYVLRGKIQPLEGNLFILYPNGF